MIDPVFAAILKPLGDRATQVAAEHLQAWKSLAKEQLVLGRVRGLATRLTVKELERLNLDDLGVGVYVGYADNVVRLKKHLEEIQSWSRRVYFRRLNGDRALSDVYVDLKTYLTPLRLQFDRSERKRVRPLLETVLSTRGHCIILGQPGAGKTTSMQRLVLEFFSDKEVKDYRLPILVQFRAIKYTDGTPIRTFLRQLLPFRIEVRGLEDLEKSPQVRRDLLEKLELDIFHALLDELAAVLVLEGFDEVPVDKMEAVLSEVKGLCGRLQFTKVVLTCRSGQFNYGIPGAKQFEIAPLQPRQVKEFAPAWLGDEEKSRQFLRSLKSSPYLDTSLRPLTLAHLCAIYRQRGRIPDSPKSLYRLVVDLLIEDWDAERDIRRISAFAKFDPDRNRDLLAHLAFHLTVDSSGVEFDLERLRRAYVNVCEAFDLPKTQYKKVVQELESHTGILVATGVDTFSFAHKSLQEFLVAEYIARLPRLNAIKPYYSSLGSELAVATALSTNPGEFFGVLFLGVIGSDAVVRAFYDAYMSRVVVERPEFLPSLEAALAALHLQARRSDHSMYSAIYNKITRGIGSKDIFAWYEPSVIIRNDLEGDDAGVRLRLTLRRPHPQLLLLHRLEFSQPNYDGLVSRMFSAWKTYQRAKLDFSNS